MMPGVRSGALLSAVSEGHCSDVEELLEDNAYIEDEDGVRIPQVFTLCYSESLA